MHPALAREKSDFFSDISPVINYGNASIKIGAVIMATG